MEALGINPGQLLAQAINFVVLFVLLSVFAYKPIMRMMDERSRRIRESMEQAETIKQQAARAEEEFKKRTEEASRQGQEIVTRAVQTGEEVRQKAQQQARQDAEALIARARAEIQQERDAAIGELRREFADMTILAAEKVIERSLDKQQHRQLIEKVLEGSPTLGKKE
ncbi:MAG: F0F1 ATP synthase subunit B [Chloroflexi bacterium]|nr:F0F1 ATP synthase subunit B [Chloroflexota bacterium]